MRVEKGSEHYHYAFGDARTAAELLECREWHMRLLREWQAVSANDPPQSLRRRSLAATLAVSLFLVAAAACVLLADRPKGFVLEQNPSTDEDKYVPLISTVDPYSNKVLSRDLNTIFSEKNKLASDQAAAAAVAASPEYKALTLKSAQLLRIASKAAAAQRLSNQKLKGIMLRHRAVSDSIAAAIKAEKESEAKLIHFARSKGYAVASAPPPMDSGLLKLFAAISSLDSASSAKSPAAALLIRSPPKSNRNAVSKSNKNAMSVQPAAEPLSHASASGASASSAAAFSVSSSAAALSVSSSAPSQLPSQPSGSSVTLSSAVIRDAPAEAAAAAFEVKQAQEALDNLASLGDD
jgi:hypothetical protein